MQVTQRAVAKKKTGVRQVEGETCHVTCGEKKGGEPANSMARAFLRQTPLRAGVLRLEPPRGRTLVCVSKHKEKANTRMHHEIRDRRQLASLA